ncbi:MAG: right-handed parallel beta-helix repeat-containing protein [Acidobacteriaceae bacterium]
MKLQQMIILAIAVLSGTGCLRASTFYVDAVQGRDANSGNSPTAAWQTLDQVNSTRFHPGDRILLRSGERWVGQLILSSSGDAGNPIQVDRYGPGSLPHIDGAGRAENVVELLNAQYIEVRHLEITDHGPHPAVRRGVLIAADNFGTVHHVVVSGLYIHDVNGTNQRKDNGGIIFQTRGEKILSRFDGLVIEGNILWKVDRTAIVGESNEVLRTRWFPSLHVVIRDNFAEDIGGDGIVPWATDGALIEGNVVLHGNLRADTYDAGIWPWSTDNSFFQLNEVAYMRGTMDGEGFDSDYNSRNTRFLYNYSHDNDGGFMLICTPGRRDARENYGNTGTVIGNNISRNDRARIFNLSGADDVTVENNAVYIAPHDQVQVLLVSNWDGWAHGALFRNNIFDSAGIASYGHEIAKNPNGTYQIAPGWGGATDIRFEGNRYCGRQIDAPEEPKADFDSAYCPEHLDWNEPVFDPRYPEEYPEYARKHREWLVRLFTAQFGGSPVLGAPRAGLRTQ